jgi:hypothetical protein
MASSRDRRSTRDGLGAAAEEETGDDIERVLFLSQNDPHRPVRRCREGRGN